MNDHIATPRTPNAPARVGPIPFTIHRHDYHSGFIITTIKKCTTPKTARSYTNIVNLSLFWQRITGVSLYTSSKRGVVRQ